MQNNNNYATRSLIAVILINGLMLGAIYFFNVDAITRDSGPLFLGQDAHVLFWVIGTLGSVVLWLVHRQLGQAVSQQSVQAPPAVAPPKPAPKPEPKPEPTPPPVQYAPPSEASALQMLSILQRRGRLIDFLQEDLSGFDDGQIGAAVRTIHEGCRDALKEHVTVEPIYSEPEGSSVSVAKGFDAHAVRLSGNVGAEPPFTGTLQHRGWRATKVDLPETSQDEKALRVIAPAEVEVG